MLYILSTPIGNLKDISLRAVEVLQKADFILAEDTRKAKFLLKRISARPRQIISFYEYNEERKIPQVIALLKQGLKGALISSAGTPLISDPGYKLTRRCIEEDLEVFSLPGPSAVISSLVVSGLPPDKFMFLGFLPRRPGKRKQALSQVKNLPATLIIFESPLRVKKTLEDVREILGRRQVVIVREQTKVFEEKIRGSTEEVLRQIPDKGLKGEVTLVVAGRPDS